MNSISVELSSDDPEIPESILDEVKSAIQNLTSKYPSISISIGEASANGIPEAQYISQSGSVVQVESHEQNGRLVFSAGCFKSKQSMVLAAVEISEKGDLVVYSPKKDSNGEVVLDKNSFAGYTDNLSS